MARKNRTSPKAVKPQVEETALTPRQEWINRFQAGLGYGVVGICVVAGLVEAFAPQSWHLPQVPPAAALGVTLLAVFRLVALRSELKRQERDSPNLIGGTGNAAISRG